MYKHKKDNKCTYTKGLKTANNYQKNGTELMPPVTMGIGR